MNILQQPTGTTIEDTSAPFELFAPQGYYTVGNKIFNHKIYALKEASRSGVGLKWHFNDKVFGEMNWREPTKIPLTDLYAARARQLREKYDHLILWWSGGADSTSMLQAFLHNNIPLDEVFVGWPIKLTEGKYEPSLDPTVSNFVSEWDLVIKPGLQWLAANYPNIKISCIDSSNLVGKKDHNESIFSLTETFQYLNDQRVESIGPIIRERSRGGKSVANLMGISPPELVIVNGYLSAYFFDLNMSPFGKNEYVLDGVVRNYEYFYASPDMPELQREMSHAALDYVRANPHLVDLFDHFKIHTNGSIVKTFQSPHKQSRRRLLNRVFHPNYNHNNFQANKQNFVLMTSGWWDIFYKHPDAQEFLDPHRWAVKSELALISPQYLTFTKPDTTSLEHLESFRIFTSKFYPIGKIQTELNQK